MGETFLRFTNRPEGDFGVDGEPESLQRRRAALIDGEWTWLRQVHGGDVVVVTEPGEHAGSEADAAVTDHPDAVLAVHTADCVPVLFTDDSSGVVGAAHAGWRGLVAGVLESTVDAMVDLGATRIRATVGPHIRGRCYEFGASTLHEVASRYGERVRTETAWGTPALDMTQGVSAALEGHSDVEAVTVLAGCTACEEDRFFSHRARADTGRHAAVVRAGCR